jgi:rare lipoprotein A
MIARARRAFPGMVMSLMLSAPVITGHAMAATTPDENSTAVTHRAASPHKEAKASGIKDISATRPEMRSDARSQIVQPANVSSYRMIQGTASYDSALIDDGTLWREQGSLATWQQTGVASWYGGARWQGHRTTSGTRYDQNELTAAHATLPIGTKVRVTLHDNASRFVIVTINDRPGTRSRIIDLSREAAAKLGILNRGVAMVTLSPQ